ncbi:minor capsid protein [Sutcliffiella horikoshii]|uniref:Minor capsid protein n=1 Tax=Sutcliffiella horikoshii TaxID=79883 RepID=A0A5D4SBY9_9BACI|nr:phage minor capsid protein [Sutcliffiella horikoshii]TYS60479.1 minor capsid protein [Sutcliffiella horikoshii]
MNLNIKDPDYHYDATKIAEEYRKAKIAIARELARVDVTDLSKRQTKATFARILVILEALNVAAEEWVTENIPAAVYQGVASTLVVLGVAETIAEARELVKLNPINKRMVDAIIADTFSDLLTVTQNMDRKTKAIYRQVLSEAMRSNYAQGINGVKTIKAETISLLKQKLEGSANIGIIDAAGRKWRPETYVETVALEKMNQAYREATVNEAVQRGTLYGIISSHNASDGCKFHEGRIVKLVPEAPGSYPTVDELRATNQIFHVRCKHQVLPIRNPEMLPQAVRDKAERQEATGRKAIAAGGRNPNIS